MKPEVMKTKVCLSYSSKKKVCLEYTNFGEKRNQLTYVYLVEYYLQEYARYEVVVVLYVAM
jgi:isocitrate dehydrogenase